MLERSWDEVAAHLAKTAGVAEDDILYTDAFNSSTYERVATFLQVARENQVESILVVSSPLHSRRISESAQTLLENDPLLVRIASTPQSYYPIAYRYDAQRWWADEADLRDLFGEYIRLVYYAIKY